VQPGDLVGDFPLLRPDGTPVTLSAFRGRPLLLIFLRHLG
jgi:peroxiredoxin